jgi:dipeptidase E
MTGRVEPVENRNRVTIETWPNMELHLFSSPGERDIQYVLEASHPYLAAQSNPTVAYLPAAAVGHNWLDYTEKAFKDLAAVALIDVETMNQADIESVLNRAALIYISGGNTFLLNHRLHQRGIVDLLRQKVVDGLPLVAFSAGTTICGPNILTSNDMNMCETAFFSSLNLTPFNFSVHYPADDPARAERDDWLQEYHAFHANSILALEDGAYLRIQNSRAVAARGNCWLLAKGQARQKVDIGAPFKT